MLTAAKQGAFFASSDPCVFFPLAATGVYQKTRVWGSSEKVLHNFSATAPLKIELRWAYENSSEKTAVGSGVSFKYDPFGRRIYKSSSSGTSIFAYDGDNLIEETNATGGVVARYTQSTDKIDEPLAMLRSGATSYYHADGLGSITSLSNAAGALAQTYTYDSFGKLTASTGSLTNPFRYTARESDTETGLYYYRARYYDPTIGRFVSEDPIRFAGDIDFYSYSKNKPITFNDPFGWEPNGPGTCGTTNCDKYKQLKRYDLYLICRAFPNDPKSNCIRLCLQQNFSAGSRGVGSYNDPPIWGGLMGGDAMNGLGQAFGPFTHLLCFKQCGLF